MLDLASDALREVGAYFRRTLALFISDYYAGTHAGLIIIMWGFSVCEIKTVIERQIT